MGAASWPGMAWAGAGRCRVGLVPTCHTSPLLGTRLGLGGACAAIGRSTLRRTHSRPDNCNTKVIVKGNNTEQKGNHVRTVHIYCGLPWSLTLRFPWSLTLLKSCSCLAFYVASNHTFIHVLQIYNYIWP